MQSYVGRMPECIDKKLAEERLAYAQSSVIIYFGKEGETIICSTIENGNIQHSEFSWKSKPTPKTRPFSELTQHLIQLSQNNFTYFSSQEQQSAGGSLKLEDIISLFSICLNQPIQPSSNTADTKLLLNHCQLVTQYILDMKRFGNSSISLDQLSNSVQDVAKSAKLDIDIPVFPNNNNNSNSNMTSANNRQGQYNPRYRQRSPALSPSNSHPNLSYPTSPNSPGYPPHPQYHPQPPPMAYTGHPMRSSAPQFTVSPPPFSDYGYHDQNIQYQQQYHGYHPPTAQYPPTNPWISTQLEENYSGDHFLELINSSGPDELSFSSLYPKGKKRKLCQAFPDS